MGKIRKRRNRSRADPILGTIRAHIGDEEEVDEDAIGMSSAIFDELTALSPERRSKAAGSFVGFPAFTPSSHWLMRIVECTSEHWALLESRRGGGCGGDRAFGCSDSCAGRNHRSAHKASVRPVFGLQNICSKSVKQYRDARGRCDVGRNRAG